MVLDNELNYYKFRSKEIIWLCLGFRQRIFISREEERFKNYNREGRNQLKVYCKYKEEISRI